MLTRRDALRTALATGGAALGAVVAAACRRRAGDGASPVLTPTVDASPTPQQREGRLASPPDRPEPATRLPSGLHPLGLAEGRDGLLFVPSAAAAGGAAPAPLALVLHGAGGAAARMVAPVQALAERHGLVLLGVDSRGRTWDAVLGGYGPDVAFVERALARAARLVAVDRRRLGIAGFSDGASYALSLGRINGDLFRRIAAFSPGFVAPGRARGQPRILVTHGRQDAVLAIDRTSRRVVPALRAEGYAVDYREFDGGHVIPAEVLEAGVEWLAG